jgi:methylated-DNA-[protein]-cysteine S-methyltransferase
MTEDLDTNTILAVRTIDSPVGLLKLVAEPEALTGVYFVTSKSVEDFPDETPVQYPILDETERQLREYFDGQRKEFDLPLNAPGTDFQQSVWLLLQEIPFGKTTSYGRLAAALGDVNKSRAVGLANGSNPISIIVPCHRVIGSDGSLTGFGGGLPNKQWLLIHEGATARTAIAPESTQFSLPF